MKINNFPALETLASNDLLLGWNSATETTRSIPVSTITSANQARLVNSNATVSKIDTLIVDNRSGNITVVIPAIQSGEVGIIDITCISNTYKVYLDFSGEKFKGFTTLSNPYIQSAYKSTKLIYLDSSTGWIEIDNNLVTYLAPYRAGMKLWLEGGSLLDKSGNGNNATAVTSAPAVVAGIDNRQVLRWAGSMNQELQISPFLSGTTAATLYCVFTLNANTHYNLIRTRNNINDYWRFANNSNGYIGTFLSARREDYPASMPSSGHHLVSIHASSTTYEVLLDNLSKGVVSVGYFAGDRFRIGTNDMAFTGDIAALLVYPTYYSKTSTEHLDIISTIKNNYPSLTLV
ncbi:hypothetical protein [Nostoc sp. 2RC]|uniref:hypothetical protein n=1 Tax=Nostoc sp. 2RC TaxID=2485484 RepID=UPI0016257401|nr:hypothetical protein [Nostoc sp. 2RC]MBC1238711.1 hypothetical protein [Nostoc sp. 2RC]